MLEAGVEPLVVRLAAPTGPLLRRALPPSWMGETAVPATVMALAISATVAWDSDLLVWSA